MAELGVGKPVFTSWLWSEDFWLPNNLTWEEFENVNNFRAASDLLYCIPIAIVYGCIQFVLTRFLFGPIARANGIEEDRKLPDENSVLEKCFLLKKKRPSDAEEIKRLAAEVNWTEDQVKRWFRERIKWQKGSMMKRIKETGWRFVFYLFISIYGSIVLINKPYLWNLDLCWTNYFTYKIPNDIWWYYLLELSFYVLVFCTQFTDVRRKDFLEMMVHHIFTIGLIVVSFVYNAVRIGSVVLLCHDLADTLLELGKFFKYLDRINASLVTFILFIAVWFPTRLGWFPFMIIPSLSRNCYICGGKICYGAVAFMYGLAALHLMWSYMIFRSLKRFIISSKVEDVRSDSEDSD